MQRVELCRRVVCRMMKGRQLGFVIEHGCKLYSFRIDNAVGAYSCTLTPPWVEGFLNNERNGLSRTQVFCKTNVAFSPSVNSFLTRGTLRLTHDPLTPLLFILVECSPHSRCAPVIIGLSFDALVSGWTPLSCVYLPTRGLYSEPGIGRVLPRFATPGSTRRIPYALLLGPLPSARATHDDPTVSAHVPWNIAPFV